MNTYDIVHLAFLAVGGKIAGKTKLQKTIYFLGLLTKESDNLGYKAHFYGPYSAEVADSVGQLHALGFLDRNTVQTGMQGDHGFEAMRYDFELTEAGRRTAEAKARSHPEFWKDLQDSADALKNAGDLDYMKMSIAAKTYFMLGEKGGQATVGQLAGLASQFGWKVTTDQIKDAVGYLGKLGLIQH